MRRVFEMELSIAKVNPRIVAARPYHTLTDEVIPVGHLGAYKAHTTSMIDDLVPHILATEKVGQVAGIVIFRILIFGGGE